MSVPQAPVPSAARATQPVGRWLWKTLEIALVLILIGGMLWWLKGSFASQKNAAKPGTGPSEPAPAEGAPAIRVDVVKPRTGGLVRQTTQPGSVHAFESVDILAKASGFLKTQNVDIGDIVKRGDVLAVIDAPELQKDVEEAAAAVAQATARAALAESRVATAEAERAAVAAAVAESEADVDQHVAKRALSEKQLERVKGLFSQNAIPQEVVDEHEHSMQAARAGERSARAAVLTARAQLAAAEAKVQQARADLAEAQSAIRLAEARWERARVIQDYTRIAAPFDGVVTARSFFPGAFIRSAAEGASQPLLTVMRIDRMRVVVQVPDLDVALLDVGDPARVVIDSLKGRSFAGTVSRLARAETPTTRTMRVEIDLENPSGLLCEGMYGRATIELRPPSKHLAVPSGCIVGHSPDGQARVFVVRDDHVQPVTVTLGADDGTTTEIVSGLVPDDSVVLNPRQVFDEKTAVVANLVPAGPDAR
jgi:RND family efflux transporter MFP subunit